MSGGILEIANAKINLSLRIRGKRPDGYHLLESLVLFADAADRITCRNAEALSLDVTGPFAPALAGDEDNLILKAARIFAGALGREPALAFALEKNLPVASGIGGGSADAAAAIRAMIRLWGDPPGSIAGIAVQLGADVPVCVGKRPSMMWGIGEQTRDAGLLPDLDAVLVNPGVAVSTPAVFSRLKAPSVDGATPPAPLPHLATLDGLLDWLADNPNDLQAPAIEIAPVIGDVLETLEKSAGARLARMSGSGATCFALYGNPFDAAEAAADLARQHPGWWVTATRLRGGQ